MTEEELRAAIEEYDRTVESYNRAIAKARRKRDTTIIRAKAEGWRQVDIAETTGYTRETLRRILMEATHDL